MNNMNTENKTNNRSPTTNRRLVGRMAAFIWDILVHPVTFVVLTILWVLDLGAGSIVAYFNDPQFWAKMDSYPFNLWMSKVAPRQLPLSLWLYIYIILSYLMVASLLLCTINWFLKKRRKLKGLAEVLVHLGFLFIVAGFILGSSMGERTKVRLSQGDEVNLQGMGINLQLTDLWNFPSPPAMRSGTQR